MNRAARDAVQRGDQVDPSVVIRYANRFEAVAAEAMDGVDHIAPVAALAREIRETPGLPAAVANALRIMEEAIVASDPSGRFMVKIEVLREARGILLED